MKGLLVLPGREVPENEWAGVLFNTPALVQSINALPLLREFIKSISVRPKASRVIVWKMRTGFFVSNYLVDACCKSCEHNQEIGRFWLPPFVPDKTPVSSGRYTVEPKTVEDLPLLPDPVDLLHDLENPTKLPTGRKVDYRPTLLLPEEPGSVFALLEVTSRVIVVQH